MRTKKMLSMSGFDIFVTQSFSTRLFCEVLKNTDIQNERFHYFDKFMLNILTEVMVNLDILKPTKHKNEKVEKDIDKPLEYFEHVLKHKNYKTIEYNGKKLVDYINEFYRGFSKSMYETLYEMYINNVIDVNKDIIPDTGTIH